MGVACAPAYPTGPSMYERCALDVADDPRLTNPWDRVRRRLTSVFSNSGTGRRRRAPPSVAVAARYSTLGVASHCRWDPANAACYCWSSFQPGIMQGAQHNGPEGPCVRQPWNQPGKLREVSAPLSPPRAMRSFLSAIALG